MRRQAKRIAALSAAAAIAALAGCESAPDDDLEPRAEGTLVSDVSAPAVYVRKVKNVLVGLPPTEQEVAAVAADPSQLVSLIDGWMTLPQYRQKMLRFFELAFQQTQVDDTDFSEQFFPRQLSLSRLVAPLIVQNATESFARTVLDLVASGRPFTDVLTTRTFMMTPALMELYAFLDAWQVDDDGKVTDRWKQLHPGQKLTVTAAPIPLEQSADPASPNFMRWTNLDLPRIDAATPGGCFADPVVFDAGGNLGYALHRILQGSFDTRKDPAGGEPCKQIAGKTMGAFTTADFDTWKPVTIRAPAAGEATTEFYNLPKLRSTNELVLRNPRVSFFSTPAFFANWQTNDSNQMRVTMNQTLIVALGAAVDGRDLTNPESTPGLDQSHVNQPECFMCHRTLDPTRSIFSSKFSWNYHNQTEATFSQQQGMFAFKNVTRPVTSLEELGTTLATHPLFAPAWVSKLCYYANSRACDASDPEFQRLVEAFKASGFSWTTIVRELFASPLTTHATPARNTGKPSEVIAVARRDHLCAALDARLGLGDVCALSGKKPNPNTPRGAIALIVPGLPSDGYGRGGVAPVLPNAPTLFHRAGTENICAAVARLVIDPASPPGPGARTWSSAEPDAAIADFVAVIMGLTPGDGRSAPSIAALRGHFDAAQRGGATASDALASTFIVACLAPSSVAIGL